MLASVKVSYLRVIRYENPFFKEIPTCPKEDLLEIESHVENSYVHNGKVVNY